MDMVTYCAAHTWNRLTEQTELLINPVCTRFVSVSAPNPNLTLTPNPACAGLPGVHSFGRDNVHTATLTLTLEA
jgi:hypothetical protein